MLGPFGSLLPITRININLFQPFLISGKMLRSHCGIVDMGFAASNEGVKVCHQMVTHNSYTFFLQWTLYMHLFMPFQISSTKSSVSAFCYLCWAYKPVTFELSSHITFCKSNTWTFFGQSILLPEVLHHKVYMYAKRYVFDPTLGILWRMRQKSPI